MTRPGTGRVLTLLVLAGALTGPGEEAPVDCAGPHSAEVVAVGAIPEGVGYDASRARLTRIALRTCCSRNRH